MAVASVTFDAILLAFLAASALAVVLVVVVVVDVVAVAQRCRRQLSLARDAKRYTGAALERNKNHDDDVHTLRSCIAQSFFLSFCVPP